MILFRQAALPAYLFLCLVFGGSAQGIWANAALQIGAAGILAWALLAKQPQRLGKAARRLLLLAGGLGLLFLAQLVPLPPGIWTALPGRALFADGFGLLGMPLPWMPASLLPYETLATAFTLLPPAALLIGMLRLGEWRSETMFAALLAGASVSVLLGILQVTAGDGSWYFYERTNLGIAVGAFANGNHYATLMLVAIPVVAALAAVRWRDPPESKTRGSALALISAAAAILVIGILLCRSAAVILLGPPVLAASLLLALRLPVRLVRAGLQAIAGLVLVAAAILSLAGDKLPGWGTNASIETRADYWSRSLDIARDQAATGSGFGTFRQVYSRNEDAGAVDRFVVNHAHNDYLEIAVEAGIPALVLLGLFLAWWVGRARHAWTTAGATIDQKAATVASAAILLHSVIDFPLRTAAIAAVMACFLALLAGARGRARETRNGEADLARHATL